jgi:hypothetical protein
MSRHTSRFRLKENDSTVALEIVFHQVYACLYHLSTVRLFLRDSAAFTHHESQFQNPDKELKEHLNSDRVVCFAHLRSFFWELHSIVDSLRGSCIRQFEKEGGVLSPEAKSKIRDFNKSQAWADIQAIRNFSHSTASPLGARLENEKLVYFVETSDRREIRVPDDIEAYLAAVRQLLQSVLVIPPEWLASVVHFNLSPPCVSINKSTGLPNPPRSAG